MRRVESASDVMPSLAIKSKASIWLQLALLLALTSCPTSHTDAQEDLISLVNPGHEDMDHGDRLYWLQDPEDGLCVGEAGMAPCGEANLWGIRGKKGSYSLELVTGSRQLGPKWMEDPPASMCLERKNCLWHTSKVGVGDCDRCGARGWDLEPSGRVSQSNGKYCLVRRREDTSRSWYTRRELAMVPCKTLPPPPCQQHQQGGGGNVTTTTTTVTSRFRLAEYRPFLAAEEGGVGGPLEDHQGAGQQAGTAAGATFKDPESGIVFPADMSSLLDDHQLGKRQVVMGGGAFRFFGINIYQVALYIDAQAAAHSPVLQAYRGRSRQELGANESFYGAMMDKTDPVTYDRSIYVKLLLPLQAATVKKSLEAEWNMDPANKKMLLDASFKHAEAAHCCGRGTELIFTWTKAGVLEVRLNGRLVEVFENLDLAQDLFYQYVCDDPISPHAKKAFVSRYPELIATGTLATPTGITRREWAPSESEGGKEGGAEEDQQQREGARRRGRRRKYYYEEREESRDMRAHKSARRWATVIMVLYGVLMVLTLPGSRRRFQERMRRGGGSMRAIALQRGRQEWQQYLTRVSGSTNSLVKLAEI